MENQSVPQYTLDEALSRMGFGTFQGLALVFAGLGWVADAMEMMLLSLIGPALRSEWGLSPSEESLLSTVVFGGMLVGSYFWGYVSDAYGRRTGFIGTTTVAAGVGLLSAVAPNYKILIMLRCLLGVGLGGSHVVSSWCVEFVPTPNRGAWMIVVSVFWTLGTILEASLAWIIMPRFGWRWLLSLSSLPSFFVILLAGFAPESPRYLCTKGRLSEAHEVLEKVAAINRTTLPAGVLVSDHTMLLNEDLGSTEVTQCLLPLGREKTIGHRTSMSLFSSLFSPKLLRMTLLVWLLFFGYTFLYYGVVFLTSELSSKDSKCTSLTLHSGEVQDVNLYKYAFISSLSELPGLLLSAVIVDRLGRKLSMEIMSVLSFFLILPLVTRQNEMLTMALLFGSRIFISATFSVVCIFAREVYPTYTRTTAVGLALAIGKIGGMICPLVAVVFVRNCHQEYAVIVFEIVTVLSGLGIFFFPFETKGRDLTDNVIHV